MDENTLEDEFTQKVRQHIYQQTVLTGLPPKVAETAWGVSSSAQEVAAAYRTLAESHVLLLHPDGEIRMAFPFSAVPTDFRVVVGEQSYWGNCIWDALGIPAMLGKDARIQASCGDCGEAMVLEVAGGALKERAGVIHFAVPARQWFEDLIYT